MRVAIIDDYQGVALSYADWSAVQALAQIDVFQRPFVGIEDVALALREYDVVCIMRERTPFPRQLFEQLPRLKCLVTTGTGNRSVDLEAALDHDVTVCTTGNGPCYEATAELTWGLALSAMRMIPHEDRAVRSGAWQTRIGRVLNGRTFGIVGLGHVGCLVSRYANAFGMNVMAWSRSLDPDHARGLGVSPATSLHDLLARSDVVSLHVPLTDGTRGLIGADELRSLGAGGVLVNTSRGPIVDESALIEGLRNRIIGGAALDTFDVEPLPVGHPLRDLDNVVLSPHVGYVADEVYRTFYGDTARAVEAFLNGAPRDVLTAAMTDGARRTRVGTDMRPAMSRSRGHRDAG